MQGRFSLTRFLRPLIAVAAALAACACSAPKFEGSTLEGKAAVLDAANRALTNQECAAAINLVEGLYGSPYTDNQVRLIRASAHSCSAGITSLIGLVTKLLDQTNFNLVGQEFWKTMSKLFYYDVNDPGQKAQLERNILSGWNATDALMATLNKPSTALPAAQKVNAGTPNEGSLLAADRTSDASLYLIFASMATIGAIENRYADPNPAANHQKRTLLGYSPTTAPNGWSDPATVAADDMGCSFAAAVLNMLDSVEITSKNDTGRLKQPLSDVSKIQAYMNLACALGCIGAFQTYNFNGTPVPGFNTGCALPAEACDPCPLELRDRTKCEGVVTDKVSCAAAGIITFINHDMDPGGTNFGVGWPGP